MSAQNGTPSVETAATAEEAASEALVLARGNSTADLDAPITGGEMAVLYRLAKGLAASGFFKDARDASQAFAKMIFGRDLGLSATQAMTDIYIVEGKPEMSANLQASKVRSSERYEYRVLELTEQRCEIQFTQQGEELHPTSVFTIEDAKTAELVKPKSGWIKYPRNMLFARAMSNGVAFHCPDVMNGIRVYAEGEISAPPQAAIQAPDATAEPDDADVVDDPVLSDEERAELVSSVEAAGVSIELLQTAAGLESMDGLTKSGALKLTEKLGELLARAGADS